MSRPDDINHVEVVFADHAVQMDIKEIETGGGAPVSDQAGFDLAPGEGLFQKGIIKQINLANGQVV